MVRLYSHLSTLGLPSWTRHSYGHQLQHLAWFSWCSIGIRTFKYRKRQQYLHSYSVYSVWFYGKFNSFFYNSLDAIMDINQFQLLFQCLDAVMDIEYFTSINLLIFILLQTETTYYFSCLQHNISLPDLYLSCASAIQLSDQPLQTWCTQARLPRHTPR